MKVQGGGILVFNYFSFCTAMPGPTGVGQGKYVGIYEHLSFGTPAVLVEKRLPFLFRWFKWKEKRLCTCLKRKLL